MVCSRRLMNLPFFAMQEFLSSCFPVLENSTNLSALPPRISSKTLYFFSFLFSQKQSFLFSFNSIIYIYIYLFSNFCRTKQIIDQYQKTLGIDIWNTHFEVSLFSFSCLIFIFGRENRSKSISLLHWILGVYRKCKSSWSSWKRLTGICARRLGKFFIEFNMLNCYSSLFIYFLCLML